MFETALLENPTEQTFPTRCHQLVATVVGAVLETGALVALVLVPLIRTQALDLKNLRERVLPPLAPRAVEIIAAIHERSGTPAPAPVREGVLTAPKVIPDRIDQVVDAPPLPLGPIDGIIGGFDLGPNVSANQDSAWFRDLIRVNSTPPPPQHAAKQQVRRVVGGDVQAAKLIYAPKPEYPPIAKGIHVQGSVRLEAIIAADGRIQELRATSGHPLLIQAALDAVSNWRYQPTLLNGGPVEVQTEIVVNFILGQ